MTYYRRYLLVAIVLLSCPSLVWGSEFRLVPSISVKEEYNSNILLATDNTKSDYITTIAPGVEMVNRTDRLDTNLLVRLDWLEYADNRDASGTNQRYNGKVRYLFTPFSSISAEADYARYSNPTLTIGTTGIAMAAVPWNRFTSSLSYDYQFTEKTAAAMSYAYGRDYFERPGYVDDISHDVNLGLVHDLGKYLPAVKGRVNAGYSYYYFSDIRIDTVMGTVGLSWDYSEIWSILVDSGIRHTRSEFSVFELQQVAPSAYEIVKVQKENSGWGWVAKASLKYKGEYGNGDFSYTRDLTPAYGLNGAAERNALTLSTLYRLSHELSILFSTGYYTLRSDASEFSPQVIDQRTYRVSPGVRYEFSKDIALDASYEYTMVDYPSINTDARRHLFFIRLYMQHPFLE